MFPGKQPVQNLMSIVKFRSSPYLCFMRVIRIDFSPDAIHCRIYSESRPRATDAQHASSLVGRSILKSFGAHGFHRGSIQSIDQQGKWYSVIYEDGDIEDMNFKEISRVLTPLPQLSPTPLRSRQLSPEFLAFSDSGRCFSYAAPAKHHPSDIPATCTLLRRDAEFISDAFSLSDDNPRSLERKSKLDASIRAANLRRLVTDPFSASG